MDKIAVILAFASTILSSCVSVMYAYIAYKKSKEPPKDEIWETATKLLCNCDRKSAMDAADDFATVYESLKLFKDNGCSKNCIQSLEYAVREKNTCKSEDTPPLPH